MIPLACCGEQLAVHARLLEEAVAPRAGAEPEEVVHPLGRLAQQRHVRVGTARADVVGAAAVEVDALALEPGDVGGEVGLDADDRLDPGGLGLLVELVGPEHVAVVGHRDRRLAQLGGPLGQLGQPRRAVEHGVLGVHVQVDEGVLAVGHRSSRSSGSPVGTPVDRRRGRAPVVLGKDPQPTTAPGPIVAATADIPRIGRSPSVAVAAPRLQSSECPRLDPVLRRTEAGQEPDRRLVPRPSRPSRRCSVPTYPCPSRSASAWPGRAPS